jgi:hypothetical protein
MTREELKQVMSHAIVTTPFGDKLDAAIDALCAALGISDAALDALAKGEACVVPMELREAARETVRHKAVRGSRLVLEADMMRLEKAVRDASPYAARDAEGGA